MCNCVDLMTLLAGAICRCCYHNLLCDTVVLVMPVIQLAETTSSSVGQSTQSLLPTEALQTFRMLSINFGSLSESSSTAPLDVMLAQSR